MADQRRVKLFRNGRNQAVRIPVEFEFAGTEAILCRDGEALILRPVAPTRLSELLESWSPLTEDWQEPADPPPEPETIF